MTGHNEPPKTVPCAMVASAILSILVAVLAVIFLT